MTSKIVFFTWKWNLYFIIVNNCTSKSKKYWNLIFDVQKVVPHLIFDVQKVITRSEIDCRHWRAQCCTKCSTRGWAEFQAGVESIIVTHVTDIVTVTMSPYSLWLLSCANYPAISCNINRPKKGIYIVIFCIFNLFLLAGFSFLDCSSQPEVRQVWQDTPKKFTANLWSIHRLELKYFLLWVTHFLLNAHLAGHWPQKY